MRKKIEIKRVVNIKFYVVLRVMVSHDNGQL